MSDQQQGRTVRERVGRLIVDGEMSKQERQELVEAIQFETSLHAEFQTPMRMDVYRVSQEDTS